MAKSQDEVEAARALVARERHGVLSTAHAELKGWPFGPLVPLARHAAGILEHMNRDHADALVDLARHHADVRCVSARMTEIDAQGCEIEVSPGGRGKPSKVRIPFPAPALTPDAARKALI